MANTNSATKAPRKIPTLKGSVIISKPMQDWAEGRGRFQVVEDAKALVADYRKETTSNAGRHYKDYSQSDFERVLKAHVGRLNRLKEEAARRGISVEELEASIA